MPPSGNEAYWLMPGETPIGPFGTNEILAQIQAGSCTWITKASLVGSQTWAPLNQLLTLAPVAAIATGFESSRVPEATTPSTSSQTRGMFFSSRQSRNLYLGALGLLAVLLWYLSSSVGGSSLSPQEVCKAFFNAKNIAEARKHVTPNLNAFMDLMATQPDFGSDSSEHLELSSEQPAPYQAGGGYYVGYRAHYKEAGNLMTFEGAFHVKDQSGWKVHDWYIFALNGQTIDPPLSMAREYEFFRDPQSPVVANRQMTDAKKQAQETYRTNKQLTTLAGYALIKGGMGKWLIAIIGVVGMAIAGYFKSQQSSTTKPA